MENFSRSGISPTVEADETNLNPQEAKNTRRSKFLESVQENVFYNNIKEHSKARGTADMRSRLDLVFGYSNPEIEDITVSAVGAPLGKAIM